PVLMAADILLYQTNVVPIGADQKQHLELARNIVDRFNQLYPDTFTMPEPIIQKSGAKIMSLAEPTQKMSKSDENENAVVRILDAPDAIMRKFKRAVTDSDSSIIYDPENKPGVSNLLTIYSCFSGKTIEEAEREFDGRGYGDFKTAVGQVCCDKLIPVQEEYRRILADKAYLEEVMKKGADEASYYARKTLSKVRRKLGFVNL
ncbi:MAG: tryptophan--tRNA ligase, partial [Clostridia bacterium]|nr:tryptophan--tRNA ligase [Clostridia bacterium]